MDKGTAGSVWVVGSGDTSSAQSNDKAIIIGWNVLPALYGDSRTHFFTAWKNDGFTKTGCLAQHQMPRIIFQLEKGAALAPGDAIDTDHVSTAKQSLHLKVVKDGGVPGDWLVLAGLNRDPEPVGRFPRSLFTAGFAERAAAVRFGGMATAPLAGPPAPMGSGYLPGDDAAASVGGIQLVGWDGRGTPVTQDLPKLETRPEEYAVSPVENGKFFNGGPA